MADAGRRRFRLWPWRAKTVAPKAPASPPSAQELSEKLTELVHFERGIATLYYYLPDETLAKLAQTICQTHQSQNVLEQGVDRELRGKDAALESWTAVGAIWRSDVWHPGDILATFGFRIIEALRVEQELWSMVVDPRAKSFGLATAKDAQHRYWLVLATGQKGQEQGGEIATAAR